MQPEFSSLLYRVSFCGLGVGGRGRGIGAQRKKQTNAGPGSQKSPCLGKSPGFWYYLAETISESGGSGARPVFSVLLVTNSVSVAAPSGLWLTSSPVLWRNDTTLSRKFSWMSCELGLRVPVAVQGLPVIRADGRLTGH